MDQVSAVKRQFREEQWRQRITECRSSGMSVKNWCKQNGLCEQTYYKYLKKFRQEMCDSLPAASEKAQPALNFQKLQVETPIPDTEAAVIIRLPSAIIEVKNGTAQQTVEAVLLALKNVC